MRWGEVGWLVAWARERGRREWVRHGQRRACLVTRRACGHAHPVRSPRKRDRKHPHLA